MSPNEKNLVTASAELGQGAAAIGVCIAKVMIERDPTTLEPLRKQANEMMRRLDGQGDLIAATIVRKFLEALHKLG